MNLVFSLSLCLISREYWSYLGTPITHLYPIGWFLHSRTQRLVVEEQQLLLQPQITAAGIENSILHSYGKTCGIQNMHRSLESSSHLESFRII